MHRVAQTLWPPLAETAWAVDPRASGVAFSVRRPLGLFVHGDFERLTGELELDCDGRGHAELRVEAASVRTGHRRRDRHLRSADYFDCDNHPTVRFVGDVIVAVRDDEPGLELSGELRAAGRSTPLELWAGVEGDAATLTVTAQTTIDARSLGMTWSPLGVLRTPTTLTATVRARRSG